MRIVYVAAGAAGMYCGSCLHDNTLAAALMEQGHDVSLVPTYTPLRTDEVNVSLRRVFFGGVNVFLQQKLPLFRHTPWALDALFDSPALIELATGRGGPSIEAEKLGDLTVSMLAGKDGNQSKEVEKLVHWLRREKPDVVHLSNSMLAGMAGPIGDLGVPVVCTLSGEDLFLEKLPTPYYDDARRLLRQQTQHVRAFVSMNGYYADFMADYLSVLRDRIHVIPHGLNLEGHGTRATSADDGTRTIGYLARIAPEKGLHLLVEAFEQLLDDAELPPLKLRVAGYLGKLDRPYFEAIQRRVQSWREPHRFEYLGEVDRAGKIAFLQSLDLFSLPTVYRESKGLSVLEALANAVPVVLPNHGAFPELVADTGGGVLHEPGNPAALAAELKRLVLDSQQAAALGQAGQAAIRQRYHMAEMAARTADLYGRLVLPAVPAAASPATRHSC